MCLLFSVVSLTVVTSVDISLRHSEKGPTKKKKKKKIKIEKKSNFLFFLLNHIFGITLQLKNKRKLKHPHISTKHSSLIENSILLIPLSL